MIFSDTKVRRVLMLNSVYVDSFYSFVFTYFFAVNISMYSVQYTVPKKIEFPEYNMKCSRENVILRGIFHVISCFPLHFWLYRGNLDYFLGQ